MTVIWLPRAEEDLARQTAWLQSNRGGKAALNYLEQVNDAVERISNNELVLYRLYDAARNIRYHSINSHTILYYRPLTSGDVELLTIFDSRQRPSKLKL